MKVYCAHASVQPYGPGGYLVCGLCGKEWYSQDAAPTVVLGVTDPKEIVRYPFLRKLRDDKHRGE